MFCNEIPTQKQFHILKNKTKKIKLTKGGQHFIWKNAVFLNLANKKKNKKTKNIDYGYGTKRKVANKKYTIKCIFFVYMLRYV